MRPVIGLAIIEMDVVHVHESDSAMFTLYIANAWGSSVQDHANSSATLVT